MSAAAARIAIVPRRGLRRADAASYVGVSPSKFDQMVSDGRMPPPFEIDRCRVWDIRRLDRAFDLISGGGDNILEPIGWEDFVNGPDEA